MAKNITIIRPKPGQQIVAHGLVACGNVPQKNGIIAGILLGGTRVVVGHRLDGPPTSRNWKIRFFVKEEGDYLLQVVHWHIIPHVGHVRFRVKFPPHYDTLEIWDPSPSTSTSDNCVCMSTSNIIATGYAPNSSNVSWSISPTLVSPAGYVGPPVWSIPFKSPSAAGQYDLDVDSDGDGTQSVSFYIKDCGAYKKKKKSKPT